MSLFYVGKNYMKFRNHSRQNRNWDLQGRNWALYEELLIAFTDGNDNVSSSLNHTHESYTCGVGTKNIRDYLSLPELEVGNTNSSLLQWA